MHQRRHLLPIWWFTVALNHITGLQRFKIFYSLHRNKGLLHNCLLLILNRHITFDFLGSLVDTLLLLLSRRQSRLTSPLKPVACTCPVIYLSFFFLQGLFRIAAGASKLKKLKAALDCSTSQLDEFYSDPHAVAGKASATKQQKVTTIWSS